MSSTSGAIIDGGSSLNSIIGGKKRRSRRSKQSRGGKRRSGSKSRRHRRSRGGAIQTETSNKFTLSNGSQHQITIHYDDTKLSEIQAKNHVLSVLNGIGATGAPAPAGAPDNSAALRNMDINQVKMVASQDFARLARGTNASTVLYAVGDRIVATDVSIGGLVQSVVSMFPAPFNMRLFPSVLNYWATGRPIGPYSSIAVVPNVYRGGDSTVSQLYD